MQSIREKLELTKFLEDGWDSYHAPKPSFISIENAKNVLDIAERLDFIPQRLHASVIGGIGITWYLGNRQVYVECLNFGKTYILRSAGMYSVEVDTFNGEGNLIHAKSWLKISHPLSSVQ